MGYSDAKRGCSPPVFIVDLESAYHFLWWPGTTSKPTSLDPIEWIVDQPGLVAEKLWMDSYLGEGFVGFARDFGSEVSSAYLTSYLHGYWGYYSQTHKLGDWFVDPTMKLIPQILKLKSWAITSTAIGGVCALGWLGTSIWNRLRRNTSSSASFHKLLEP